MEFSGKDYIQCMKEVIKHAIETTGTKIKMIYENTDLYTDL